MGNSNKNTVLNICKYDLAEKENLSIKSNQ